MKSNQALTGIFAATLLAALLFGCLQEKQANGTGDEPTPPPLPDEEFAEANDGLQATATLGTAGVGGNDDSPPPLPG